MQWRAKGRTRRRSLGSLRKLTRDEARKIALELMAQPLPPEPTLAPLLKDFVPTFLADCAGRWKPSTRSTVEYVCRRHVMPALGTRRVDEIDRASVLAWFDASRSCRSWALSVLSSLLIHAEALGHRQPNSNPCLGLRHKKTGFKARYPTTEIYRNLGIALSTRPAIDRALVQAIQFLALTGARRAEALALQWEHVHADRIILPDSKTGPKTIWLPGPVRELIASVARGGSPYVFGSADRARASRELTAVWQAVRVSAGVENIRLHDLRHGYASVAVRRGVELKSIAGLLGHTNFASTMGYAHLRQDHIADAAERVSARLSDALQPPPPPKAPPENRFSEAYPQTLPTLLEAGSTAVSGPPPRKLTMEEEIELYYASTLAARDGPESPREYCERRHLDFTEFRSSLQFYRDRVRSSHHGEPASGAGSEEHS